MVRPLMRIFLLLLVALSFQGCSLWHRKPKPSTHIYSGDSPRIKNFDKPEAAGGELNTY